VNSRGVDAGPDEIYAASAWANQVYLAEYLADGAIEVNPVGRVQPEKADGECLGRFGEVAELCQVVALTLRDRIEVTLSWNVLSAGQPNDTVFVQLVDAAGQWAAGADGDSLGGLLPLTVWRPGDRVTDVRRIGLPRGLAAGNYTVRIGLYNRVTGERLPGRDAANQELPDMAYSLAVQISP
jgi:hypothetical protein